jgi:Secretion system C-terminal sorting domain
MDYWKKIISIVTSLILSQLFAIAQNLVTNPSFETFSACPNNIGQVNFATGWFNVPSHPGNPDYLNTCATVSTIDVPINAFGNQSPASGNGYVGLVLYYQAAPNWREYIETQLTSPMVAGQTYTIQFQASLGENSQFSSPSFQFYFSNTIFNCVLCGSPITTITPQVSSTSHITSKNAWTTVTATYTALGGEQYMTIGNFRNDVSTPIAAAGTGLYSSAYYYLDDITVTPIIPLPVELSLYEIECNDNKTQLNWTTATETNNDYFIIETSKEGIEYSFLDLVQGAGNSNQPINYSYPLQQHNDSPYVRLSQTDFNGEVTNFSPKYIGCENTKYACPELEITDHILSIYFNVDQEEEFSIDLYNYSGQCINHWQFHAKKGENQFDYNLNDIQAGMYFVNITGVNINCSSKIFLGN